MTKVLVTGAGGQLGKTIEKLTQDYANINFFFTSSSDLDITKASVIEKYFKEYNPDYCINCAAYTNVEQAEKEPEKAFSVNAEGVRDLSLVCKEYNTLLIHISTDYVFDGKKARPYTTEDTPNPINEYGKSKLVGEKYIQQILKKYFIIRTSWLYSKEFGKNFYKTILEKAKTEKEMYITTQQTGCPTDAENLAVYMISIIENNTEKYGLHHFCDGEAMTWYDFAKKIILENKLTEQVKIVEAKNYRTFARRPEYSVLRN
ncbi:dTDP-4-dehydrorhamnose reductase [Abyssalbus ytuae]|uniref:dTDP-4-dehydrorhamnose reductase n=1 Tax=Abyssalbus ytuae TaxID=2926907 RepID=A0A9E6ZYP7_9FLAO|nr:dTDP-4-dehydrorhamnose reductase [Abyssalbus ytuae]UOB19411.1 dTDP-4-dehydrorhamnose reductase [Abyssalbus ytuae]